MKGDTMTIIVILTSFFAGIVYGELFRRVIRRRPPTCSQGYDYEVDREWIDALNEELTSDRSGDA